MSSREMTYAHKHQKIPTSTHILMHRDMFNVEPDLGLKPEYLRVTLQKPDDRQNHA